MSATDKMMRLVDQEELDPAAQRQGAEERMVAHAVPLGVRERRWFVTPRA
jgi:hypothetical protein